MTRAVRTLAIVCLAWTTGVAAHGAGQTGASSAAQLAGRVESDEAQHNPIRGAIVTVSGDNGRARSMVTDDNGAFDFRNLPAGRYTITASKAPYVPMAYGAKRPGRAGTAVTVTSSQAIRDLVIQLPRGAVITGTLRDHAGAALSDVAVTAVPMDQADSQAASRVQSYAAVSDDRGVFRIYGVPSGRYLVAATFRVSGVAGDISSPSATDVDRVLAELGRASTTVGAGVGRAAPPAGRVTSTVVGFAPTFFPGTTSASDAEVLKLASGELRTADFVIAPARTGSVEGVILMPGGSPVPQVLPSLSTTGPPIPAAFGSGPSLTIRPGPDGRFKFSGVLPGKYTLIVSMAPGRGGPPAAPPLFGMAEVVSSGDDITGLSVTMRPSMQLSGRIVFEAGGEPPPNFTAVRVALAGPSITDSLFFNAGARPLGASGTAKPDGTFEVAGIVSAAYVLSATAGPRWSLKSAVVNGRDVLDDRVEFSAEDITNAVLTFTDRHSELSGSLQIASGAPAADHVVVVFPVESAFWRPGARRIQSVRPATDGHFAIRDLPAGNYLIAALTDVDPQDLGDPAFLAQLVASSVKVTLADGETKTQNLRIAK